MSGSKVDAKVVLLGKEFGGKTSLVERYLHNRFAGDLPYQNTIGAAYGAKRTEVRGKKVVLGIWDTAGSERYQAMSRIYYRNAWAAIICFDLTEAASWDKAKFWAKELKTQEPTARLYFVGTKIDLLENEPKKREVEAQQVHEFVRDSGLDNAQIFETSSRTGEGVMEVFQAIAEDYVASSPSQSAPDQFSLSYGSDSSRNGASKSRQWCNC